MTNRKGETTMGKRQAQGERRQLTMHPNLLRDVVFAQAGTREKAILEGTMNAVDAGATSILIELDAKGLVIADDGRGFPTRDEIIANFEMFGTPHEDGDATYGRFRMGRGQLFAKGANTWRSRTFRMEVDAKKELSYRLVEGLEDAPGCRIEVKWYDKLLPTEQQEIERALARMVKYVSIPITVNGRRVNADPAGQKWDHEDDDARYKFTKHGSLAVYNLGVLVSDSHAGKFGVGGTVVSKRRLTVNFARNDVMSDCAVWKRIAKEIRKRAERNITGPTRKSTPFTDAERERACLMFMAGELEPDRAMKLKLFTDVTGAHWSLQQVGKWLFDAGHSAVTTAPARSQAGDVLFQHRRAFVFSDETWERFGLVGLPDFLAAFGDEDEPTDLALAYWSARHLVHRWTPREFGRLAATVDTKHVVVPEAKWTPTQRLLMETLRACQYELLRPRGRWADGRWQTDDGEGRPRRLEWGKSEAARAWTDGETYVALNLREIPSGLDMEVGDWIRLGLLLHHEYCHADSTIDGHLHGPDFADRYQATVERVAGFVHRCIYTHVQSLDRAERTLKREEGRLVDRIEKAKGRAAALERRVAAQA
jgi:hypothetical protein